MGLPSGRHSKSLPGAVSLSYTALNGLAPVLDSRTYGVPGWPNAVKWATLEAASSSRCKAVAGVPEAGLALGVPSCPEPPGAP
eukprot:scaffold110939_cov45-Phaeocystis_antarctica.AAC.1